MGKPVPNTSIIHDQITQHPDFAFKAPCVHGQLSTNALPLNNMVEIRNMLQNIRSVPECSVASFSWHTHLMSGVDTSNMSTGPWNQGLSVKMIKS